MCHSFWRDLCRPIISGSTAAGGWHQWRWNTTYNWCAASSECALQHTQHTLNVSLSRTNERGFQAVNYVAKLYIHILDILLCNNNYTSPPVYDACYQQVCTSSGLAGCRGVVWAGMRHFGVVPCHTVGTFLPLLTTATTYHNLPASPPTIQTTSEGKTMKKTEAQLQLNTIINRQK